MAKLTLTVLDAGGDPLSDSYDLHIVGVRDLSTVLQRKNIKGDTPFSVDLPQTQPFMVHVFPRRYRPVGLPTPIMNANHQMIAHVPIHPDFAKPLFPKWSDLKPELRDVLVRSELELAPGVKGEALYDALSHEDKAGLLNVFTKMHNSGLPVGKTAWGFVEDIYRIRPDRIFANVGQAFRDAMKTAEKAKLFKSANDSQHKPPPDFDSAGSFKSRDRAGNLQVTFFSKSSELKFKIDADIDDANGLGHVFQVLEHWIKDGDTHPYDIHQILTLAQSMKLPYDLTT